MTTSKVHLQSLDLKKYKYPQQWHFKFFVWYLNFGNDPTHFRSWHLMSWLFYYQIYSKQKSQNENFGKLYKIELNVLFYFLGVNFLYFFYAMLNIHLQKQDLGKIKKVKCKIEKKYLWPHLFVLKNQLRNMHILQLILLGIMSVDVIRNTEFTIFTLDSVVWQSTEAGVLKNFAIFTRKHLCWNLFLIKLQAFSCKYCKIFKINYFLQNISGVIRYDIKVTSCWYSFKGFCLFYD